MKWRLVGFAGRKSLRRLFLLIIIFLFATCSTPYTLPEIGPRYIFLFIGDGMGLTHVEAARLAAESAGLPPLSFTEFPVKGRTSTLNSLGAVTDSAAAATAIATGHRTTNGVLSTNMSGTVEYATLPDLAKAMGMKVGVITSVSLNHATPAAFYAHSVSRDFYHDIALQLADSDIDFFGGGGLLKQKGSDGAGEDALVRARTNGFTTISAKADFEALLPGSGRIIASAERLVAEASMPYELDRMPGEQSLADFVTKAAQLLENDSGFFIMIEGGKIDWASHDNNSELMIPEVLSLGSAVDAALNFLHAHPDDTLIVVTSDHETGGPILDGSTISWTRGGHTSADVGVFAKGLGNELFEGSYRNTGIFDRMKALLEAGRSE